MLLIDYKDRRPIYEQIVEKFQQMILCGVLEPDAAMPSVRSLAMELSLNPNTIQRAYQELEKSGYIYSIKGKGSFVNDVSIIQKAADSKKAEIQNEMLQLVKGALSVGITRQDLTEMLENILRQEGCGDISD